MKITLYAVIAFIIATTIIALAGRCSPSITKNTSPADSSQSAPKRKIKLLKTILLPTMRTSDTSYTIDTFDKNGTLLATVKYAKTIGDYTSYRYDARGNLLEVLTVPDSTRTYASPQNQTLYTYDSAGNRIEEVTYLGKEKMIVGPVKYSYNSKQQVISSVTYNIDVHDTSWNIYMWYKYDSLGRVIEEKQKQKSFSTKRYTYPDKYTTVEISDYPSIKARHVRVTTRNELGDILKEVNNGDTADQYVYADSVRFSNLDSAGNWRKKVHYRTMGGPTVEFREIQYY